MPVPSWASAARGEEAKLGLGGGGLSALLLPAYKAVRDLGELDQREGDIAYFLDPPGKPEDLLESPDACRAAEQKPPPQGPSKASAPPLPQGDPKRPAEPLCTSQFAEGLPTDLEEQRTFLTERCIAAFHLCLSRFPQHYKSLYRLACLYACSPTHKVAGVRGLHNYSFTEGENRPGPLAIYKDLGQLHL